MIYFYLQGGIIVMIFWKNIREILKIAIPAVGEMTLYMTVWIFDTMMVGKYGGKLAVSSVGLSTETIYSFFNIIIAVGISTSLTSLISRALGARKYDRVERYANAGFKLSILIACFFFSVLFFFPEQILKLAGATQEMLPTSIKYAKICSFSFFLLSISSSMNGVFRGIKDTKTSMYVAAIINVVNLCLDYILIFGKFGFPELGVTGAAIATVAGNLAGILFQRFQIKKLPFKIKLSAKVYKKDFYEIIRLAVPAGLQEANSSLSKLLGLIFIISLGTVAFAANQIVIAVEAVSTMSGWGIAIANTALVGHSIGEKNEKKASQYTIYSIGIASVFMIIIAFLFFFIPEIWIGFFIQEEEIQVISAGAICLQIAAFEQIPIAITTVLQSYFKGAGLTKLPFYISFFTNWIFKIPLAFYFIVILKYPVYTFWIISLFQWSLEGAITYFMYIRHLKKKINIEKI